MDDELLTKENFLHVRYAKRTFLHAIPVYCTI